MKYFITVLISISFLTTSLYSQKTDSTLSAEISLIKSNDTSPNRQQWLVALSFKNNSDRDIYIPDIAYFARRVNGGIFTVTKNGAMDWPLSSYELSGRDPSLKTMVTIKQDSMKIYSLDRPLGRKAIPVQPFNTFEQLVYDTITYPNRTINDPIIKKLEEGGKAVSRDMKSWISDYCLFLKAGQRVSNYYIAYLDNTINKPGKYQIKFICTPQKDSPSFPEHILGYNKYIPKEVECNTIDISVY